MNDEMSNPIWIVRDYIRCTGCRRCEISCSLRHEGKMWPEAARIRVFMPFPGVEVPHLCAQCDDYPCVASCPTEPKALSVDAQTEAVIVNEALCISCGNCIKACPGTIPFLHPATNKAVICDLCGGDPECVKVCVEAGYNALRLVEERVGQQKKLHALNPQIIAEDLAVNLYGEKGEEVL
ncbi:oxidoreductase [miscellaneous Crenarchaeota group archaeon SMTZ1-55]|nr:MAG: oxidoreductase [miscellaneous Crenarchaeota group archaeon SMTZ1-55]